MKKILTITLFVINILSFGQSDSLSGDLTRDVRQHYNPGLMGQARHASNEGFFLLVDGAIIAGVGAAYICGYFFLTLAELRKPLAIKRCCDELIPSGIKISIKYVKFLFMLERMITFV